MLFYTISIDCEIGFCPLQEKPLDPTAAGLFPQVDWLIGNHSDELTPWIPVMAARYATGTSPDTVS